MDLPLTAMYRASVESLSNAEAFIEDAKALINRGSYGHALALLVLAEEELGKSFLWQIRMLGIEVPERLLRDHVAKQVIKFSFLDLMEIVLFDVLEAMLAVYREPDPENREEMAEALPGRLEEYYESRASALQERLEADFSRLIGMDELKMRGLYVDVHPDGTILSPARFSEQEALEQLKVVEGRYKRFSKLFPVPREVAEDEAMEERLQEQQRFWEEHKNSLEDNISAFISMLEGLGRRG